MKPLETVRYACHDCQIVFDLCVAPPSEWVEQYEDIEDEAEIDTEPIMCPFCGADDLKPTHDRAIVT